MLMNWAMRRLLSADRDAATLFLSAPEDGRKWTISALVGVAASRSDPKGLAWQEFIDGLFWPGHCAEAMRDTLSGKPLELTTVRARIGALRTIWAMLSGRGLQHIVETEIVKQKDK